MHPVRWLAERDRGLVALRRAGRVAIVMPALFALGDIVIGQAEVATFAAFGSFALVLFVDFGGPMRERLQAQAMLSLAGAVLVVAGTLASRDAWLAAAAAAVVAFCVIFAGVVSSVLAGATTSLLLAFILAVSLPGPASSIPDRLAGWGLASVAAFLAVALLWPAPVRDPLRGPASRACRAQAERLRSEVAFVLGTESGEDHEAAVTRAATAVADLRRGFLSTPYRPTGLRTSARTLVRLVDELSWLEAIARRSAARREGTDLGRAACAVKAAAAGVLEAGANLLEHPGRSAGVLRGQLGELRGALDVLELTATVDLPVRRARSDAAAASVDPTGVDPASVTPAADEVHVGEVITSLELSFRAQELSYAVAVIGRNVVLTAAADRRGWLDRLLGRQPAGLPGRLSAAQERAAAHVEPHSVWLHNSLRGAAGLGAAVLVADLSGVQHSFWVVLGTLSVLRSNALNTGQNAVRGVLGTVAGFVVGAAVLAVVGTNTAVLWFLLPPAVLVAGVAPAAISFAAGQAAFTLALVILFNIIQPAGWRVGLLRVEDIVIGCSVSLIVGVLFWPRGAAAALNRALAEAYADSARYLASAVDFGMSRCDSGTSAAAAPDPDAVRAAAASRRLDDTFRTYLAERGAKPVPLAEITALVTGVTGLRLAADAVLDLWHRDDGRAPGDRAAARRELLTATGRVESWYEQFARGLLGRAELPATQPHDPAADGRLVDSVRHDLRGPDGGASATAVRMIWTGDHLDVVRRLQNTLVEPARATAQTAAAGPGWLRPGRARSLA